jgi:hypothetical protein
MKRRCAVGVAEPLGIQQPKARLCGFADNNEAAVPGAAT